MGGFGSGGGRSASKMDEFHKLDLADFKAEWFQHNRKGRVTWSRGGQETSNIGYSLGYDWIELSYVNGREPNRETVHERIPLAFTEQPFGGCRRWFICRSCGKRCRVLIGGAKFRCRLCYRATYPSQYERVWMKGVGKAERVRDKLKGEPGFCNPFPAKPKGMHWRTYKQLEEQDLRTIVMINHAMSFYF